MTVATFKQPDYTTMSDSTEYPLAIDASIAVLAEVAAGLAVHERDAPDLQVTMDAGKMADRTTGIPVVVPSQDSGALVAPTVNPRHDIVYLDKDGFIGVAAGAEAGAPEDPAISNDATALARIRWTVAASVISNDMLDDLRVGGGGGGGAVDLVAEVFSSTPVASLDLDLVGFSDSYDRYGFMISEVEHDGTNGRLFFELQNAAGAWNPGACRFNWYGQSVNPSTAEGYASPTFGNFVMGVEDVSDIVARKGVAWGEIWHARLAGRTHLSWWSHLPRTIADSWYITRGNGYLDVDDVIAGCRASIEGAGNIAGHLRLWGYR